MLLHHPLLYDSNATKASLIASVMSNNTSRSCIGPSHISETRLKLSKRASGGNAMGLSSKARGHVKHWTTNVYGQRAQERVLEEEAPQVSETIPSIKIFPGQAFPLGVSEVENGINFAIFSQHASAVTLCLSFPERWDGEMMELALDPHLNKTGDIWHICIEDFPRSNVLYGYRIDGPRDWHRGHRFDSSIVLLDPYAKLVEGRRYFGDASKKFSSFLGTYDFESLPFDWGETYKLPNIPEKDLVIYEMNVRAFTFDESSELDPKIRGSYLGVIEKSLISLDCWQLRSQECRWLGVELGLRCG
ncbi:hypothetical protein CMV_000815 [Castanea mollissima]|uniref:Glycoside hydrolase family 13 N-terminal domain-containing protein n=1 Tax=Castanea mollissima TaxID=60419 RepID=A0A8J4W741_9ROSI|nr:hypothetical protein CMV_000815 [Castanea mollissima]